MVKRKESVLHKDSMKRVFSRLTEASQDAGVIKAGSGLDISEIEELVKKLINEKQPAEPTGMGREAIEKLVKGLISSKQVVVPTGSSLLQPGTNDPEIIEKIKDEADQRHQSYLTKF